MTEEVVNVTASEPVHSAPVLSTESASASMDTVLGSDVVDTTSADVKTEVSTEIKSDNKSDVSTEIKTEPKDLKSEVKSDIKVDAKKDSADGADKATEANKEEKSNQSDEPAPLPSYEPWKFPETMAVDDSQVQEINKMFGEFELEARKDPHAAMQKYGQQFLDKHLQAVQTVADKIAEAYKKSWQDQTKGWYDSFVKDPEIGGNRKDETAAAAREFIRRHGGNEEQQKELRTLMQTTGIGNHPAVIRAFAKATANLSEPMAVPAGTPPAQQVSRKQRFYGKKS